MSRVLYPQPIGSALENTLNWLILADLLKLLAIILAFGYLNTVIKLRVNTLSNI